MHSNLQFSKIFKCKLFFRVWFPEDLSEQGMTEIDAKLLLENKQTVQSTFDRTKLKQKIFIPWKMQLEIPLSRGRWNCWWIHQIYWICEWLWLNIIIKTLSKTFLLLKRLIHSKRRYIIQIFINDKRKFKNISVY